MTLLTLRSKLANYSTTERFIYISEMVKIDKNKRGRELATGNRGSSTREEQWYIEKG